MWQASRNPNATSYQESRCLFLFENEPSIKLLLPCWKNNNLPSFNILPVLLIQWAFVQQSSSHQSPVPNIEHTCRCQAATTVRDLFSPLFPFLQRVSRSMKSVSFAMLRAEKAGVFQTHETLCQEDSWLLVLLCDCFHKTSHYEGSRCLIRFGARLSRALNNSCHAGRINTCPNSMSCQSCQLMGHSCSNPVHSNHQYRTESTHSCRQEVTTVTVREQWENYSLHSFLFRKGSDQWRVSPSRCAMLRAEKLEFSRHMKACVKKILDSWLLMPLRDRLPSSQLMAIKAVDTDMSCFLLSSYPMPQRFANKCNDTVGLGLPAQMSPTVAMTKFLFDWCEGLVHPSSFAKELPILFATTERLNIFPQLKVHHIYPANLLDTVPNTGVFSCRCQPVTTGSLWDCETTTGIVCFAMLMAEESWARQTPQVADVGKKICCWCCVTTAMQMLQPRFRFEWAKHGARPTFTTEFQMFAKLQEAFLLPAGGSRRWGLQQQPCSRCCTAKSEQHLRHKQRMMIHPEWNQRSLSYGAIL